MPSSSAYAAPLDLDLRPGRMENAARWLILALALLGLAQADLPLELRLPAGVLAIALALRDARRAARRPANLRLHADGSVECASGAGWLPATLQQSIQFAGWLQLQWDCAGTAHAAVLFPDRIDGATRQRLRVWLATHRPLPAGVGVAA
ncbi:MAG: hypothetical protein IPK27_18170 [Rhodanobacteraceae bacterium]|nr:hypothetical protein [Rhodanobacteraceae bacterium]